MNDAGRTMIRALIVDDEEPGRLNLRYALAAHPRWRVAAECASAAAARQVLAGGGIDVVFLDIQMPRESGLELARALSQAPAPPLVIFVTAYNEHAVAAFDVHALDYLLKPLDDARLAQALARACAMLAPAQRDAYGTALRGYLAPDAGPYPRHLGVRSVGRIDRVDIDDVLWLEAAGNYVQLHLAGRALLHRVALSRLEQHLDPRHFVRVHRGAIVRRAQMSSLAVAGDASYLLALRCGASVPVSERHVDAVRRCMG